jgi:hypothetical protein
VSPMALVKQCPPTSQSCLKTRVGSSRRIAVHHVKAPPLRKLSAIPWSPQVLSVIPAEVLESLNVMLQ